MNLRQLEIFCAVIRCRTTVSAAVEIGISQPAISSTIKNLEDQLGFLLFERLGNRLIPTAEAITIYKDAEPLYLMSTAIRQKMIAMRDSKYGNLRIFSTQALSRSIASDSIRQFLETRPDVRIFFDVRRMEGVVESVETGLVDLGFAIAPGNRPNIEIVPLVRGRMVAVMPRGHPLSVQETITPRDLEGYRLIGIEPASRLGGAVRQSFERAGASYVPVIDVRHGTTACMLVERGLGVAVVDEFSAGTAGQWHLEVRHLQPAITITACMLYRKSPGLPRLAARFLAETRRNLGQSSGIPIHDEV